MPELSVIVPAYNSVKSIEKCLLAIRGSSYREYELIVVDDGSRDGTLLIAEKYADKIIRLSQHSGRNSARQNGIEAASAEVIVNIDSDVLVQFDTLGKIADYLSRHPEVDAITGLLSKEHPNPDFFSQYKNLYMHYIFSRLPQRVTFLYGSICALRRDAAAMCKSDYQFGVDTAYGQELTSRGKKIAFLRDLEVTHLKKYNLLSFIRNDFMVPFNWAGIFITYNGWNQLGKNRVGFAHAPVWQLISVPLSLAVFLLSVLLFWEKRVEVSLLFLVLTWLILNLGFFKFLLKEKGPLFFIAGVFVTFLDNMIMALGIICGFPAFVINRVSGLVSNELVVIENPRA
jgi:glycosyltransferase involved in cell wall biosynthesis